MENKTKVYFDEGKQEQNIKRKKTIICQDKVTVY